MTLSSGARLGPYEIQAAIGAGGMGEVYKARDTRLDRTVAIKILPPEFSADPERRARFEREAKTIAGLNHPHICTLHDVGDHEGSTFLVMEHLTGETLAERLQKGPLPLEQALSVATEIADALAAAHRQGVIHRDLKPGNVMLTKTGAKLLDFGLAKLRVANAASAFVATTTAATMELATEKGVVLGTVPYMAPEQLEGKDPDARADIFSFGAVLYEMLTGRRAFEGESQASVIAAILTGEPPAISTLQPVTPPSLDRLVRKCLAKDRDARWQSASDVADEMRWVAGEPTRAAGLAPASAGLQRWTWPRAGAVGVALLLIGALAGLALWRVFTPPPRPLPVQRFAIPLAEHAVTSVTEVAISPDGSTMAFAGADEKGKRLYLRRLDRDVVQPLEGTEGALNPCFSPDGKSLAFRRPENLGAAVTLYRVPVSGGPPIAISSFPGTGQGISWTTDDRILFVSNAGAGVSRIAPAAGSTPEVIMPGNVNVRVALPLMLPGGDLVLVTTILEGDKRQVSAWSIRRRTLTRIVDGSKATYLAETGALIWRQASGNLLAASFDLGRLAVGQPVVVAPDIASAFVSFDYAVSSGGLFVQIAGGPHAGLAWVDRSGRQIPLPVTFPRPQLNWLALSPDGRRAALSLAGQLHIANLETGAPLTPLTEGQFALFTPDGSRVLFTRKTPEGGFNIYSTRADGGGTVVRETHGTDGTNRQKATSIGPTRTGNLLLFNDAVPKRIRVGQQHLGKRDAVVPLFTAGQHDQDACFSPDGRWIAYASDASGRSEIYVRGYPDGPVARVSTDGGYLPVWNPNGAEVFFQNEASVFVVTVLNGAPAGPPKALFKRVQWNIPGLDRNIRNWDTVDGQRFLVEYAARPIQIQVVNNWFEELKAKLVK